MTISKNEEFQYLNLIETVISTGEERKDRTGTGTISIFAPSQMRFSLLKFPLLTTKKMHLRGIFEELKWFIRGSTNSFELSNLNVNIWNKNQLDVQERLDYEPGDLGPIYGFQWRHFGAEYLGLNHDYTGKGKDQLFQVFEQLIYNPNSRRIIISAWNPYGIS
jgi:thymidylate synthase